MLLFLDFLHFSAINFLSCSSKNLLSLDRIDSISYPAVTRDYSKSFGIRVCIFVGFLSLESYSSPSIVPPVVNILIFINAIRCFQTRQLPLSCQKVLSLLQFLQKQPAGLAFAQFLCAFSLHKVAFQD